MESNAIQKYRLLVLLDQSKRSVKALRDAVNLAKMINGSVEVFRVKLPSEVVGSESPLAVFRSFGEERLKVREEMGRLVDTISLEEGIPITYSYTVGNVVNEVQEHIEQSKPDIVVVGKRKANILSFLRDGLTSHLLRNHKGGILISGAKGKRLSADNLSLGFLDDKVFKKRSALFDDLSKCAQNPPKYFKIKEPRNESREETLNQTEIPASNATTFEFDDSTDVSISVANYIDKSNVSLLFVHKSEVQRSVNFLQPVTSQIQKTIDKTKVPVLIMAS